MAKYVLEFEKPIIELEEKLKEMRDESAFQDESYEKDIEKMNRKLENMKEKIYGNLTPWQRVQLARHLERPLTKDYIEMMFDNFLEIHGDRCYKDDSAVICGFGELDGIKTVIVGQHKGGDTKERIERNFGMMHPEGYRKALRAMKLAEKFNLPVLTFIDTPGAYPGIGAEERGQGEAIAKNLREMSNLKVPIISTIIGEGASGGALGIGVADRILMCENAWYSVISPEGCAAILYKDGSKKDEVSENLKLDADSLLDLGVIDEKIKEPLGGANRDPQWQASKIKQVIVKHLKKLFNISPEELIEERINKFNNMGIYEEE